VIAGLLGALTVALGAFGAHALKSITTDAQILHGYETAVEYQFYHTIALLVTGMLSGRFSSTWITWAGRLFITGIILFSGSLYILSFLKIEGSSFTRFIGPITPLGGLAFILGWLCLVTAVIKTPK
jgi:uncharacterized membrane protein YgdD (TMEM256/DUF423 family)